LGLGRVKTLWEQEGIVDFGSLREVGACAFSGLTML